MGKLLTVMGCWPEVHDVQETTSTCRPTSLEVAAWWSSSVRLPWVESRGRSGSFGWAGFPQEDIRQPGAHRGHGAGVELARGALAGEAEFARDLRKGETA